MLVSHLMNNIEDVVINLGINKDFVTNPAFIKVLAHIYTLLDKMEIDNPQNVIASEYDGIIGFDWVYKPAGDNFDFKLFSPNENEIKCERIGLTFIGEEDTSITMKIVDEITAKLDENGGIKIDINYAIADNAECAYNNCIVYYGVDQKKYDPYGVMVQRETRTFPKTKMRSSVRSIDKEQMLLGTRNALQAINYRKKKSLIRDKIDVVDATIVDRNSGIYYSGKKLLESNYGLSDLAINENDLSHVVINPLTYEEIEAKLENENPIVREGLKQYVDGRDSFTYDSDDNKEYIKKA